MKHRFLKRIIICIGALLVVLSVIYFIPKPLLKDSSNLSVQRVYYESTETNETGNLTISDSGKQELLDYLKTCKIHGTLYPPSARSSADYLYIHLLAGSHHIGIHLFGSDSYVQIDSHPFQYYFTDADEVHQKILDILERS